MKRIVSPMNRGFHGRCWRPILGIDSFPRDRVFLATAARAANPLTQARGQLVRWNAEKDTLEQFVKINGTKDFPVPPGTGTWHSPPFFIATHWCECPGDIPERDGDYDGDVA